ncbi:hypothetical protein [Pseudarthrobacter sp. BIM B-2242]|uniref:hypothetical protein n=1 Tax=Pseudarthrobacter sp. BIM B-2242 TaxID=2772401 RepID=UPI00168AD0E8|nr:hypothetical protein [Pseudarthrobacter sp. BIM B-2242]QOD05712.1 hypothetical protein IDT60_21965 [Pseudarthrobacter sp. BIM B-2242]
MATLTINGDLPQTIEELPAEVADFPFAISFNDSTVFASTRTELTAQLIEGYAEIPEGEAGNEKALLVRYRSAVDIANTTQGLVAGQASESGQFDPATETEDTLTALFTDKDQKIDEIAEWTHKVPLVLVASGYAPYNSTPRPTGNVLWLDPYTETTYLESLAEIGLIELLVREDV